MAKHDVQVELPRVSIGKSDAVFSIQADGHVRGRLTISRGGVGWLPIDGKKEIPLSWEAFDKCNAGSQVKASHFGCQMENRYGAQGHFLS